MLIKLLKEYGDFKVGELVDTDNDADAKTLIDNGTAEKYVAKEPEKTENEVVDDVVKLIKAEITRKPDIKIPAQPKDNKSPWPSFGDFAKAVHRTGTGTPDNILINYCDSVDKASGMGEAILADGGFMIPTEFSTILLTALQQQAVIHPKCMNMPVNNNIELPFVNITSQANSWTGGVRIYKPTEASQKTSSKPSIAKVDMKLHKMTALVYVTDELLADSPIALQTFLSTMVSTELALTRDEDIINGSGAGEALGILGAPCMISVTKETDQPADTIYTANVLKMASRMYAPSFRKAIWLISQDAMPQIATLSIDVGTGGAVVFIADLKNPLGATLLGRPIEWSPHCQTIGDEGDIIFADFSQYVAISKAGRTIDTATSIHLRFDYNETAFRFEMRANGQPWWAQARTPKHGSNTVSPFVSLEERT